MPYIAGRQVNICILLCISYIPKRVGGTWVINNFAEIRSKHWLNNIISPISPYRYTKLDSYSQIKVSLEELRKTRLVAQHLRNMLTGHSQVPISRLTPLEQQACSPEAVRREPDECKSWARLASSAARTFQLAGPHQPHHKNLLQVKDRKLTTSTALTQATDVAWKYQWRHKWCDYEDLENSELSTAVSDLESMIVEGSTACEWLGPEKHGGCHKLSVTGLVSENSEVWPLRTSMGTYKLNFKSIFLNWGCSSGYWEATLS
jgi:hypothetical protein